MKMFIRKKYIQVKNFIVSFCKRTNDMCGYCYKDNPDINHPCFKYKRFIFNEIDLKKQLAKLANNEISVKQFNKVLENIQ